MNRIFKKNQSKESDAYLEASNQYSKIFDQWVYGATKDFIIKNAKSSPVSILGLRLYTGFEIKNPQQADSLFNILNPAFKDMSSTKTIRKKINAAMSAGIGKQAPLFTEKDTSGVPVSLISFRGKYVLLDFWASWCVPCREENPNLILNYNKYRQKNFTIISVSLDRENEKNVWLEAIKKDNVGMWTHVSSLQSFNNPIAKLYGVSGIPQNFLIDPSGKIIAINLKGNDLTEKLNKLLASVN